MRLTLRTLLAYLDDVLEPSQAKEIGEKMHESSFAASLVSRIREVMRRRRLTAPALSGPGSGIDPNTVAEYLDNTLAPESIADVEKICLDSDVHLAEVAACHQVLTLVLGEPVEITAESRERMYALGPAPSNKIAAAEQEAARVPAGANNAASHSSSLPNSTVAAVLAQAEDSRGDEMLQPAPAGTAVASPFHESIPDYLRPRPLWRRAAPYAVVAVLLAGWISLISMDSLFVSNPSSPEGGPANSANSGSANDGGRVDVAAVVPKNDGVEVPAPAPPIDGPAAGQNSVPAPEAGKTAEMDAAGQAGLPKPVAGKEVAAITPKRGGIDAPPPADVPEDAAVPVPQTPAPQAAGSNPAAGKGGPAKNPVDGDDKSKPAAVAAKPGSKDRPGSAASSPVATRPLPAGSVEAPAPAGEPPVIEATDVPPAKYVSAEGVMLHYVPKEKNWYVLPRRALVHIEDLLAVPEPFEEVIEFHDGRGVLKLLGGTSVRILGPVAGAPFGLELKRGRIVLRKKANANDASDDPLKVTLEVHGETWRLELMTAESVCGVEVALREPNHLEQDLGFNSYNGAIYVAAGTVQLVDAGQHSYAINGPGWYPLTPEMRTANGPDKPDIPPPASMPKWLGPQSQSPAARQYAKPFEKEFDVNEPVDTSIAGFVNENRPELSRLAVECLGLVGADGALIDAMQRTSHEEARKAAIGGLRTWLPQAPENRERLKDDLAKHFSPENADAVYRLLWGYNEDDARNRVLSQQLVDWMGHDEIVIRELAFFHVHRLTNKKYDYRPNAPSQQRQLALTHWQQHITKTGALLSPKT